MSNRRLEDANPFYFGCSPTELSKLFDIPLQSVRDAIRSVSPSGKRGGSDLYRIRDAAAVLIREKEDDAEKVRRLLKMNASDLPPKLSRDFWSAETQRQKYEITAGDLWPTTKVVEWLAGVYKHIRLSLTLLADTIERTEPLTPTQREIIVRAIDATLNDAAERLIRAHRRNAKVGGPAPSQEDEESETL